MKNIFLSFICCICFNTAQSQNFQLLYDINQASEAGVDAYELPNGEIITLVYVYNFDELYPRILKLNASGDTIWTKSYLSSGNEFLSFSFTQVNDSEFVMSGHTLHGSERDFCTQKINDDGAIIWSKTFSSLNVDAHCMSAVLHDQSILQAGHVVNYTDSAEYISLIKLTPDGQIVFSKMIDNGSGYVFNSSKIIPTADSGFAMIGTCSIGQNYDEKKIFLIKLDNMGNILWSKNYIGGIGTYEPKGLQTSDHGFIITATLDSLIPNLGNKPYAYLFKTDSMGNIEWSKIYDGGSDDRGQEVVQNPDGSYVMVGASIIANEGQGFYMAKTTFDGSMIWNKFYGRTNGQTNALHSLHKLAGGGFMAAGVYINQDFDKDFYLIKTDEDGNIDCGAQNYTLTSLEYQSTVQQINYNISNANYTVADLPIIVGSASFHRKNPCLFDIDENTLNIVINIYPNPSGGIFTVDGIDEFDIKVMDMYGRVVLVKTSHSQYIDLTEFAAGVYIASIRKGNKIIVNRKLIVE